MFRSVLAVLGGFATMAVIVIASTPLLAKLFIKPGGAQGIPPNYLTANLVVGAIAALLGGMVTVQLAPDSAQAHFVLARAYTRAGRTADAERERKEFARLDQAARKR